MAGPKNEKFYVEIEKQKKRCSLEILWRARLWIEYYLGSQDMQLESQSIRKSNEKQEKPRVW